MEREPDNEHTPQDEIDYFDDKEQQRDWEPCGEGCWWHRVPGAE